MADHAVTRRAALGAAAVGVAALEATQAMAQTNERKTFLLIHGAWHGGWCWRRVAPLLEPKGHQAVAADLPGHGADQTPTAPVTPESYTARICEIAGAQSEPVILVGHSMGGIAITQAAEDCPDKIRALVYL